MRTLSKVQQEAAYLDLANIALSAGAGSGKTSVIVERIIAMVTGQGAISRACSINNILAVTFTDKAARELKERLVKRLTDNALIDERRQIETAYICTIHALCARLLQENPFEAGLDPGFEVLSGEASNDFINLAFYKAIQPGSAGHKHYSMLVSTVSQWSSAVNPDTFLLEAITNVFLDLRASGCFLKELTDKIEEGGFNFNATQLTGLGALLNNAVECAVMLSGELRTGINNVPLKIMRNAQSVLTLTERLIENPILLGKLNVAKEIQANTHALLTPGALPGEVITLVRSLSRALEFTNFLKPVDESLQEVADEMRYSLVSLLAQVWEQYSDAKMQQNVVDIDDLQELAVRLIEGNPAVAQRYCDRFVHIIVDEFQDTSLIQMRLLDSVRRPYGSTAGSFFVVGDRQQSIYAFRNADPRLFNDLCRQFDESDTGLHLTLEENYRTHPVLLNAVNGLFQNLWANTQHPLQQQVAGRLTTDHRPRIELLVSAGLRGDYYRRDEAHALAQRIVHLISTREKIVCDRDEVPRAVQYGDIAIVLRSLKDLKYIEQSFLAARIPFFVIGGVRGYYSRAEIRDILNLLTLLTDPHDDLAFVATIRSPFAGFGMGAVTKLVRYAQNNKSRAKDLYGVACSDNLSTVLGTNLAKRIRALTTTLDSLRVRQATLRPVEILQDLIDRTGYDARVLARQDGRRKLANLRKLQALAAAEDGYGVSSFIGKLRNLKELSEREGDAPTEEEDANVVRILTIHSAKGLEFPVVIAADLGRPLMRRENRPFLCDGTTRTIGVNVNGEPDIVYQMLVRNREERERAEYMRLLYVAMTRARDYLVLAGDILPVKGFNWAANVFPAFGLLEVPSAPTEISLVGGHRALVSPIPFYVQQFQSSFSKVSG